MEFNFLSGVPETDRYKLDVPPSRLVELPTVGTAFIPILNVIPNIQCLCCCCCCCPLCDSYVVGVDVTVQLLFLSNVCVEVTILTFDIDHPLGGFITTYKAICEFYSVPPREDIIWDMENLFVPGHIKDFNLKGN
jgi:hypothetical protein